MGLKYKLTWARALASGVTIAALAACSGGGGSSSSPSTSSTVSVSGSLTQLSAAGAMNAVEKYVNSFDTANTKISLDCGTAGKFEADVNATNGKFSASGVPKDTPCTFSFVNSSSGVVKCQVSFKDTSSYDLNNNPMTTSTATVTSNVELGAITCDTDGNIEITSSSVSNMSSSAVVDKNKAFDFTGTYSAAAYDGTLPSGAQTIEACVSDCHGPGVGDSISLVRFHGQKFTPDSGNCTPAMNVSCPVGDGTVDATADGFGMSIWGGDYAHGIGACGGKTGFTADEARAYARLSLDSTPPSLEGHALSYDHYAWSTPTGFGTDSGWTAPWMYGGAQSKWDVQDCMPVSIPATSGGSYKAGYACFAQTQNMSGATGVYVWNVGMANSGGCVDGNNNPIMVSNWANLTGSCSSQASSFNSNLMTNSCTYHGAPVSGQTAIDFTCSFTGGPFKDISNATGSSNNNGPDFSRPYTMPANTWQGQSATILAKDATCGSASVGHDEATLLSAAGGAASAAQAKAAKELMVRYQCYANAYWEHRQSGAGSTTCARDYNFNWSTNNPAQFVTGDDRSMKPQAAFITDRVFYSPDGQWAFLKNVQMRFQNIPTANGSTLCPMNEKVELKFKRINDNKLLVDFTQVVVMADKSPTCQGAVAAALAGGGALSPDPQNLNKIYQDLQPQHMIFYLNK